MTDTRSSTLLFSCLMLIMFIGGALLSVNPAQAMAVAPSATGHALHTGHAEHRGHAVPAAHCADTAQQPACRTHGHGHGHAGPSCSCPQLCHGGLAVFGVPEGRFLAATTPPSPAAVAQRASGFTTPPYRPPSA